MGKRLSYILLLIGCMLFIACTDNILQETACGKVELKLTLNLPEEEVNSSSRVTGSNTDTPYLDETTKEQRYIQDVAILAMRNGKVDFIPENIKLEGEQGSNIRTITMTVPASDKPIDILVLLNAKENGIDVTENNYIGKTEIEVHDKLVFKYPVNTWDINDRKLPMFGKAKDIDISSLHSFGYCDIYRSLAKMAVQVDEDCKTFNLKEVYLYYMEQEGYFMSVHTPETDVYTQYTQPDVPTTSVQTGTDNAKKFDVTDNAIFNKIYLLESNNKTPQNSKKELKVVVGGYYTGEGLVESGKLSYYRIDMSDERDQPFDIIRNHSYIFNITNVNNPGTPSPDKALDHAVPALKVEVEDWVTEYMRGAPDQYTLKVDKSVVTLNSYADYRNSRNPDFPYFTYEIDVWTDYVYGWEIETRNVIEKEVDKSGNTTEVQRQRIVDINNNPIDWLEIEGTNGTTGTKIKLNADKINTGLQREASFYIKAGNILKQITVIMPQPETANCYVVDDQGYYEIIVNVKGNGAAGTRPEGVDIVDGNDDTSEQEDASIKPYKLGIIWETTPNLISLYGRTNENQKEYAYVEGKTQVLYEEEKGTLGFSVRANQLTDAYIGGVPGGNALIGAFDESGKVIWSWHIWICAEMYQTETHQINHDEFLDTWQYTGYQVMDRNLGALSAKPLDIISETDRVKLGIKNTNAVPRNEWGVAAMGLQYQWGRKDPFIGPAYSNDNFDSNNETGLLPVEHYYEVWGVNGDGEDKTTTVDNTSFTSYNAIDYTIVHPTQLVHWTHTDDESTALVSYTKNGVQQGQYLWGTNQGLSHTNRDLGTKTIYDPCPVGYRVPPVDAFYFKHPDNTNVNKNSFDHNFRYNIVFIPHYAKHFLMSYGSSVKDQEGEEAAQTAYGNLLSTLDSYDSEYEQNEYQWGNHSYWLNTTSRPPTSSWWAQDYYYICYEGPHVNDADYYGFYLNMESISEPELVSNTKSGFDNNKLVVQNLGENASRINYYYKPADGQSLTWLPLTGAYDPTIGISFKDGEKTIEIERGSSISVNSFLWTNSSVEIKGKRLPGALALHGAEVSKQFYGNSDQSKRWNADANGRHIHGMMDEQDAVQIQRHFTSAVRCIRDTKKLDVSIKNSVSPNANITIGGSTDITIISLNAPWKLVDAGAPWLKITPENGGATTRNGQAITLTLLEGAKVGDETTITFQIEGVDYKCKVKVVNN